MTGAVMKDHDILTEYGLQKISSMEQTEILSKLYGDITYITI